MINNRVATNGDHHGRPILPGRVSLLFAISQRLYPVAAAILLFFCRLNPAAIAQAFPGILYVAPGGSCGGASPCYATVQAAVDAAVTEDEIRLAVGTYTGVNNLGGLSQMVHISKTVTLRGGYTTTDWGNPDPVANVTELNAQTLGRVVYIAGSGIYVQLHGLHLIYGSSSGLKGHGNLDAGGGVYIKDARVLIDQCWIRQGSSSSDGKGGGVYMVTGELNMTNVVMEENAAGDGGAVYLYGGSNYFGEGTTTVTNSQFRSNRVNSVGGAGAGIAVYGTTFTIQNSLLASNRAPDFTGFPPGVGALNTNWSEVVVENTVVSGTLNAEGFTSLGIRSPGIRSY